VEVEVNKKILWIDDDYYAIQGLFRPIQKEGYLLDEAISALDGYHKAKNWEKYDLIVVDLILPISQEETAPQLVKNWDNEDEHKYVGIGLAKWLLRDVGAKCPVVLLSVVADPISTYNLQDLGLAGCIRKSGLLPSKLMDDLLSIMENKQNNEVD
jgi:CheY-like chemotaxis protein